MQFQLFRGSTDKRIHVLCRADEFYNIVPDDIRHQGPWQVIRRGEMALLQAQYRQALAKDGCMVIEAHPVGLQVTVDGMG